jgi:signal transduction histidine kinase/ActR/RegA family two-component response regulator
MTAIAVSLAGGAMLTHDLSVYRNTWANELSNQAAILGISTAPALEFDDHQVAERNLLAMRVRPRVWIAALYRTDGRLYAAYTKDPHAAVPSIAPRHGQRISGERVELSQPVTHNGEELGTIYMLARYDVIERIKAYLGIFALVMAASLAVAYVLSDRFQRSITAPLQAMAKVARGIVERRDYSQRALVTADDEIGTVVLAFNNMLDEVEARERASAEVNSALEIANRALQDEIRVRQVAEAALREADQRKDEFLATLAHELRNPLAPIRHAVKLLETKAAEEHQQQWGREVIGRQVQRMALLLDDLLDVSRITRGRLDLKIEEVDLRAMVDAALEIGRPLIDAKAQHLKVILPEPRLRLSVDPLRLSQALSNLLTNAAKYTDENGDVTLRVELSATEITFSVKDTGIGLEPQTIPRLFELFSQLDAAINRAEGGLGIGLALVKGLVELHGGSVEAVSAGVGLGSEFVIHLPRALVNFDEGSPSPALDRPAKSAASQCKVLMADDNRDAVDSMAMVLEIAGYEVCVAYNGKRALELAQQHRPDVVILDIGMPDMTGHEVATAIRQTPWGRAVHLIAITGWGQSDDIEKARDAGFDLHLTKPVDIDRLEDVLKDYVRGRESV